MNTSLPTIVPIRLSVENTYIMLIIKDKQLEREWQAGEALPLLTGSTMTFVADGPELRIILAALKNSHSDKKKASIASAKKAVRSLINDLESGAIFKEDLEPFASLLVKIAEEK